ncbi:nuclear transport factor 2 family protein [Pseudonocardia cypriaca]|uniref:Ketosteroid isomerase-like protein n=1 Tax=Pseudonocardia cypriaca TaxID=882449 RepID=A0A543FRA2_9PSEU|nr:nuclear transport factor 2 family protein [Pseudonocardia cypriaca]TQM36311.1 ketosteroid isomerase-like protein [Pseudonocardia cypriaca]
MDGAAIVWRPYNGALRRLVPVLYRQASAGRHRLVLAMCRADVHTCAPGTSPLGGVRGTRDGFREWWSRLRGLTSAIELEVHAVSVSGPPWATAVRTEWTDVVTAADGARFTNHGTHRGLLRWGRLAELHYDWDPDVVLRVCEHAAAIGVRGANAPPVGAPGPCPVTQTGQK